MSTSSGSGIFRTLFGWLPNWVGFGLIILAGILAIVFGALGPNAGLIAFGIAAILAAIVGWYAGGRSTPEVNPFEKSFGASVDNIDGVPWLIIFGLFVIAALVAVFTR